MLFIEGMLCPLCNNKIIEGDEITEFPPIIGNRNDPLWVLSDAVTHKHCYESFPSKNQMEYIIQLYIDSKNKGKKCDLCGELILLPDDHFSLGFLAITEPLADYNFLQVHKKCISYMRQREELLDLLKRLRDSGEWNGAGIDYLINTIEVNI